MVNEAGLSWVDEVGELNSSDISGMTCLDSGVLAVQEKLFFTNETGKDG